MKKYLEKIAKTLGTWSIFENGATPASKRNTFKAFAKVCSQPYLLSHAFV